MKTKEELVEAGIKLLDTAVPQSWKTATKPKRTWRYVYEF